MTNPAENWNAQAQPPQEAPKPAWKPEVIQGGANSQKEKNYVPEDVVLGGEYAKAYTKSTDAPVDLKELFRETAKNDSNKMSQIRRKIDLPEPKPYDKNEQIGSEEFEKILTKPNIPKPREHGVEAPVNISEIMNLRDNPEPPKFEGAMPAPKPYDKNEQIDSAEFEKILTKPNIPKPREHDVEAPVDMSEVLRETPESPKFEGKLPEPPEYKAIPTLAESEYEEYKEPEQLTEEDIVTPDKKAA
jgi:hypothetical protein